MKFREFYFLSSNQKTNIYCCEYYPESKAKGIIQILHGLSESSSLYHQAAIYFVDLGYIVRMNDHLSHGKSRNEGQCKNYFGKKGSWIYALEDIHTFRNLPLLDCYNNDLPYVMIGHSLGGFLLRDYISQYKDITGAIISGSGIQPILIIKLLQIILKIQIKLYGEMACTDFVHQLMFVSNNKKIKSNFTDYDWLFASKEALVSFMNDPNTGGKVSVGIVNELFSTMISLQKESHLRSIPKDLPLLFIGGIKDPSTNFGKSLQPTIDLYQQYINHKIKGILYPNSRHCIFQDLDAMQLYQDIDDWIISNILI